MIFRMSAKCDICFDVKANTSEEAVAKAREQLNAWADGLDVNAGEIKDVRVYPDGPYNHSLDFEFLSEMEEPEENEYNQTHS